MSKGTVRFPESAIADGRVGTARIREQIAGAAARLTSTGDAPLDTALVRLTGGEAYTSERLRMLHRYEEMTVLGDQLREILGTPKHESADLLRGVNRENLTAVERMQALGRLGTGRMNKTEAAYELEVLKPQLHAGEILWYRFEAIKLRLADNTFITIDFPVITAAGQLEFREVKGRWTDDARAKTKIAAAQFPFRFIAIHAVGRGSRRTWRVEDLTSRSW